MPTSRIVSSVPFEWEQVRVFLAVMRGGSLAAAAGRLSLDVSTVSRRIDRLEKELGAVLFDRTREGTTPTSLAEEMQPAAEEMELAAIQFAALGSRAETAVEGTVRLTVPPGIADAFVAPQLPSLFLRYPRLVVDLEASVTYADLTRREADLAIRSTRPTTGEELVLLKLVEATSAPLTSPSYARELGKLNALEDARWIAWGNDLGHLPDAMWLKKHGPMVTPVFRTSHFGSQLAAARAGLGVLVAARPFASTSGLVEVEHTKRLASAWSELPVGTLWLVGHRALRTVPRVAAVWSFLVETFAAVSRERSRSAPQAPLPRR